MKKGSFKIVLIGDDKGMKKVVMAGDCANMLGGLFYGISTIRQKIKMPVEKLMEIYQNAEKNIEKSKKGSDKNE